MVGMIQQVGSWLSRTESHLGQKFCSPLARNMFIFMHMQMEHDQTQIKTICWLLESLSQPIMQKQQVGCGSMLVLCCETLPPSWANLTMLAKVRSHSPPISLPNPSQLYMWGVLEMKDPQVTMCFRTKVDWNGLNLLIFDDLGYPHDLGNLNLILKIPHVHIDIFQHQRPSRPSFSVQQRARDSSSKPWQLHVWQFFGDLVAETEKRRA